MARCIWKEYTKEQLEEIVKRNESYMGVARELGYKLAGTYVQSINTMIQYYGFDISHFTGQAGSNRGNFKMENFTTDSKARTSNLRPALIHLRGHRCECCGNTEWLGQPITLEIHHINGNNTDHSLENLQLLCPNCHSLTENWRKSKPNTKEKEVIEIE